MKAAELLEMAYEILEHARFGLSGSWPRAVALLGRQALEEGLDTFWEQNLPQMRYATRRSQTLCLEQFVSDSLVTDGVKVSWAALTRACHHHPFELSPTEAELKVWLGRVETLVEQLSATMATASER